jgi:hypothetical protein
MILVLTLKSFFLVGFHVVGLSPFFQISTSGSSHFGTLFQIQKPLGPAQKLYPISYTHYILLKTRECTYTLFFLFWGTNEQIHCRKEPIQRGTKGPLICIHLASISHGEDTTPCQRPPGFYLHPPNVSHIHSSTCTIFNFNYYKVIDKSAFYIFKTQLTIAPSFISISTP